MWTSPLAGSVARVLMSDQTHDLYRYAPEFEIPQP